jgi:hypothetical protein
MLNQSIWISYDLGVSGDYEGLYSWLDDLDAKECGDSVAFINTYNYESNLIDYFKADIKSKVKLRQRDRIYLWFKKDGVLNITGKFIFGNRKASPWEGCGSQETDVEIDG